jgi:hypothetical protein
MGQEMFSKAYTIHWQALHSQDCKSLEKITFCDSSILSRVHFYVTHTKGAY